MRRIILCIFLSAGFVLVDPIHRHNRLNEMRNRMMMRRLSREELKPKVCYELVGCFVDFTLKIKRPPEHPNIIQTRFLLYTRELRNEPEVLEYGDNFKSILRSRFDVKKPLKVIIHGFKGSGGDVGAMTIAKTFLDQGDFNVLIADWTRGAGTTYGTAVANTELVGRQLGLVLLDMINLGMNPNEIHVVGFSLGAHVAGCAAEVLKQNSILLGRITGLDPASPFFRRHLVRELSKKLDATDARLVDVVHTDGSEDFADGFGLLKPLGHIDFFPNGGRQQPGCVDVRNSVVVSHFKEEILDKQIACSHLRAWQLFSESIQTQKSNGCKFEAWTCPQGEQSYSRGTCFPGKSAEWSQELGYASNSGPLGIFYLATRGESPYCGKPLRASVGTTKHAPRSSGILFLKIFHANSTTTFQIRCFLSKKQNESNVFYNIAAAEYRGFSESSNFIKGILWYQAIPDAIEDVNSKIIIADVIVLDTISIEDRAGNKWQYCKREITVKAEKMDIKLSKKPCNLK